MGEGEIVIEMVREWAEDTRYLRKEQVGRRGPGRPQDKWRKAFIAEVVAHLLDKYPRLDASKNPATAMPTDAKGRKVPENACAIVAEGLRRAGIQVTDKAVADSWDRSRRRILRYAKGRKLH